VFKKFFGKKNDGFFMRLEDEDASSKTEAKAKAKPESAPTAPVAVVKAAIPVAPPTTTEVVATTTSAPVADPAPAPATGKVDKKADKKVDKKVAKKVETLKVAPAPVVTAPAAPPITSFASEYLIKPSSNSSRRMPGANMRGFLDLARQVEKPKAFKPNAADRKSGE
jgi:hypothetical protein